jgi:predicted hotdog family 3-hydroxylacyl-ACP dehydratase
MSINPPALWQREDIARHIPHQGSMCLLDRVLAWDANQISCEASSHRSSSNPLRAHGRLGASCGIEYAAQVMAVHGALIATTLAPSARQQAGYLASVRSVKLHTDRLDTVDSPLTIQAERLSGDSNIILYQFSVTAGALALLSGRAVVVLEAAGLNPSPATPPQSS